MGVVVSTFWDDFQSGPWTDLQAEFGERCTYRSPGLEDRSVVVIPDQNRHSSFAVFSDGEVGTDQVLFVIDRADISDPLIGKDEISIDSETDELTYSVMSEEWRSPTHIGLRCQALTRRSGSAGGARIDHGN